MDMDSFMSLNVCSRMSAAAPSMFCTESASLRMRSKAPSAKSIQMSRE
jgi:hypothetical protein